MSSEQEDLLKMLRDQVHVLMSRYSELRKEFDNLILENEELRNRVTEQDKQIEGLQQQYSSAKMASGVLVGEQDKETARTEINRIVREIDNCIALLNR